jgi:hypothetical protein
MIMNIQISQITRGQWSSDGGIMVSKDAFQIVDPGYIQAIGSYFYQLLAL